MKTVVAGALGECVHVAGITSFLHLAEAAGWKTVFLGPAVPIQRILDVARDEAILIMLGLERGIVRSIISRTL